jgi:hypothetical protein
MKRTRIDILVRTAVLPALILMMSLTGCSLVMDDDTRTPSDGKATLILNIATSREGTPGIGTSSPTRGVTVTPDDYYGPETGELMRTLRVIIANGAGMVEHNLFFDNLGQVSSHTTDKVHVVGNDRKTIYLIANEEAFTLEGDVTDPAELLGSLTAGSDIDETAMKNLVLMADKHKPDWNDNSKRLLPITNIEHFNVGEAYEEPYSATLYVHRAAVKYTFLFNNETNLPVSLDSIYLRGESDREFLFPVVAGYNMDNKEDNMYRPTAYHTPRETKFREVREKIGISIPSKQPGYRIPRSLYFTEGSRLAGTHTEGDKIIEDVYKVSVVINGVQTPWRKLDWFYPEKPSEIKEMTELPRNTHVVVQFTLTPKGISAVACVQPYAEQKLEPFFGLERDKDGNLIRWHEDNDTFWADNPRYGIDGDTREYIHEDIDGDEIVKQYLDGSFLCVERIYRDWIHGDDEHDSEYYFEKDHAGGNMIIVRNNTKAEEDRKPQDSLHDHPVNERPLFVKLTAAFHKRNGYTDKTPIGCHMIVSYDEKGNPSFSRLDAAGDSILQANGYQFKASSSMDKWTNTYLVKHKTGTDADGKDIFILRLKYRNGKILIPEYTAETAAAYVRPSEEELERNE